MSLKKETHELLTIFVETLTGTTFQVTISPQDRVKAIKTKIQKDEGIPVSHQHLLYNLKELKDSWCVTEPSVALHDRATVKLVLNMRGGPISLVHQTVPLNKAILKSLVKFNCEDLLEDLPPGCKMAILVLRVGDQLNLLHIVDDMDDSFETLSNGKEDLSIDSLEGESSKSIEENSVTMEKVCDLKERMEKLSLHRKSMKAHGKNKEIVTQMLRQGKPGTSVKLPSIPQIHTEVLKTRSEFSQVPVLPDILRQPFKSSSRNLVSLDEEATCAPIRPKTCPGGQLYNVDCQNALQISQPHFRSCVSACTSKVHHEWGGAKTLLQSLNILPPIPGVPEVLSNHRKIPNIEHRNSQTAIVPSIDKLNLRHRNLSSTPISEDNEAQAEPALSSKTFTYSEARYSDYEFNHDHDYALPAALRETSMELPYYKLLKYETKNNLVEPINKKVNVEKKSRLRCTECKKRLSVTSTFECRCGFAFCSYHRYSETHHCSYDFKKENRKMLEQANPSVVAPKLPKI